MENNKFSQIFLNLDPVEQLVFAAVPQDLVSDRDEINASLQPAYRGVYGEQMSDRSFQEALKRLVQLGIVIDVGNQRFIQCIWNKETQSSYLERVPRKKDISEDARYKTYLSLRLERLEEMLRALAEVVDVDTGLALLDVAEDTSDTTEMICDYIYNDDDEEYQDVLRVKDGWFLHQVEDSLLFTQSEEPPTVEEVLAHRQDIKNKTQQWVDQPRYQQMIEENKASERKMRDETFAEFEPDGSTERPYYNALLDKIKMHVPQVENAQALKDGEPTKQTRRRGMCDIRVKGISQAPEYRVWCNIVSPSNIANLSAQNLGVQESWLKSTKAFIKDVGYRPDPTARLRRINVAEGWYAHNVEWRVNGVRVPGRQRKPDGWPYMGAGDRAVRALDRGYDVIRNAIEVSRKFAP